MFSAFPSYSFSWLTGFIIRIAQWNLIILLKINTGNKFQKTYKRFWNFLLVIKQKSASFK